jgi:putative ABC transport system permease protein
MGLTVGMTSCFLIFMYVKFELSYDSMHSKANHIYRIVSDLKTPSDLIHTSGPSWAVAPHTKPDFPQVEEFVRVSRESFLIRRGNVKFQEDRSAYGTIAFVIALLTVSIETVKAAIANPVNTLRTE